MLLQFRSSEMLRSSFVMWILIGTCGGRTSMGELRQLSFGFMMRFDGVPLSIIDYHLLSLCVVNPLIADILYDRSWWSRSIICTGKIEYFFAIFIISLVLLLLYLLSLSFFVLLFSLFSLFCSFLSLLSLSVSLSSLSLVSLRSG